MTCDGPQDAVDRMQRGGRQASRAVYDKRMTITYIMTTPDRQQNKH